MDANENSPPNDLELLGKRIFTLIQKKGYSSVYQFWIHAVDEEFSRRALENIVRGESDLRFSSLLKLSKLLEIPISELVKINELEEDIYNHDNE